MGRRVSRHHDGATVSGVAAFDLDADVTHPLDFQLMQNGAVCLFHGDTPLRAAVSELTGSGYELVDLDAARWTHAAAMHDALAAGLGFPGYYSRNLAALHDCLSDVAKADYGWSPEATGLVVTIRHFDRFTSIDPATAWRLADIFACQSARGLLFGHRILWLLQVDDASFGLDPVGGYTPTWNPAEWRDSRRAGSC